VRRDIDKEVSRACDVERKDVDAPETDTVVEERAAVVSCENDDAKNKSMHANALWPLCRPRGCLRVEVGVKHQGATVRMGAQVEEECQSSVRLDTPGSRSSRRDTNSTHSDRAGVCGLGWA